ncbi:MAG: glycosyltransferase family 2 protein [Verrucomicrobia subdivision 3 bacterium]|nr:glycosyltransferase family 2 protein [Limisphaerales bacterium]
MTQVLSVAPATEWTFNSFTPEVLPEPRVVEVSVVIPCLNEADTIGTCIQKAQCALREHGISGEVVIADNGSTDGSREIARQLGARVICVANPGYGSALMGGIEGALGRYIIMGDADDSYDFLELPKFIEKLREGHDLVQGCRLASGGGTIKPGAMPFSHRWIGNPLFSWLVRRWFQAPIHDVYCGLRGFSKNLYQRLGQRCTGMEFATEMIIKASLNRHRIAEVPITLHPDGRKSHPPHLRTFSDGWRTLRFFLMCSPRWLFFIPGAALAMLGVIGYMLAMPATTFRGITFDAHTLLFASLFILCGYQSVWFAVLAKTFAITEGLLPEDKQLTRLFRFINLEKGLLAAAACIIIGGILLVWAIQAWFASGFGRLDYAVTMRRVVPGATLVALGFQTGLSSFFISLLGMRRK